MKHWISLCALSCSALLVGCSEPEYLDFGAPKVQVLELSNQVMKGDMLYFPAIANAAERSHLSFRVSGEVSRLYVKEGDRLSKGDLIAELDPIDYQLDVDNASARYAVIDSQFNRSRPLVEKGSLAQSQFDEIAANRQIALAELQLAKLRLSYTKLRAPVDGIISRVNVDQFENIQVGQQLFNIHSTENVEVLIQLPDQLLANQSTKLAREDIEAVVRVPSGNEYIAKVKEYTTEPNPVTGTFTATLTMPMPETELILDGMAVEVTSKGRKVDFKIGAGVYVPIEALFNADGDSLDAESKFVWVLNQDDTVSKQSVTTGKAGKDTIQILEGLSSDQSVVVSGVSRLREGLQVQVLKQESSNE